MACAVDALERDAVKRIILTRPAVEAGERLGFLPGDLASKVDPYLRPLYDALYDLLGFDRTQKMFEKQVIEVAPLAYMRGRTLNHAFVILDEGIDRELAAMGLPPHGIRAAVRTGDTTQAERNAMRRRAPHILVSTPESLYVMLGSESGRAMLATVRTVIVDEIHAVAGSKRGSHLSLSLERLDALCGRAPGPKKPSWPSPP